MPFSKDISPNVPMVEIIAHPHHIYCVLFMKIRFGMIFLV